MSATAEELPNTRKPDAINDAARIQAIVDGLEETWPEDHAVRANPTIATGQFHSSVPVLKYLDWRLTVTARGYAESVLPLNVTSTNQHITHQAAVILIAADYTGGVALSTLLHGVPLVGIQPQPTEYAAYLWGAKADITWLRPSVADLVCRAEIPKSQHERIVKRFFSGRRVLETVRIDMTNDGVLVAVANLTYWAQDTFALRRNAFDETKVHPLYDHRHKTSARLIAGIRALEQDAETPLFRDPYAATLAGKHGRILAERFVAVAPPLQPMVAARTRHLDDLLTAFHQDQPCQVVNIGAGLDTRTYRIALPAGSAVFDVDLPLMLRQRGKAVPESLDSSTVRRVNVPLDLRERDLAQTLLGTEGFDQDAPTLYVWEGGSMYFTHEVSKGLLRAAAGLMRNSRSRLWMDYVHESVVDGTCALPTVTQFIEAMRTLGEPFISGFSDLGIVAGECGLRVDEDALSSLYSKSPEPVFNLYRFAVMAAR